MSRPCTVCEHTDRAPVEIALANGVAARVVALRYGLSPDSLHRHHKTHMDTALIARLRVRGSRSDEELAQIREVESKSLLDHLAWQRGRLYRNADRAAEIGDHCGERAALGEAGRTTERIGKLLGELGANITINNTQINFAADPRWHAIRTELVRALRPHPAAWQDAIAAIERAEGVALPAPAVIEAEARVVAGHE